MQFIENLLSRRMSQNPPPVSTRSFSFPFLFFVFYCFGFSFSAISGGARCDTPPDRETERGGGQRRTGGEQERASNQRARPSVLTLGANQRSAKNKDLSSQLLGAVCSPERGFSPAIGLTGKAIK